MKIPFFLSFIALFMFSVCRGITYEWDFGDGTTHSYDQNPTHVYQSPGTYQWTLTINDGGIIQVKNGSITISPRSGGFVFSGISSPQQAGVPFGITIHAVDDQGIILNGFNERVQLKTNLGSNSLSAVFRGPGAAFFGNGAADARGATRGAGVPQPRAGSIRQSGRAAARRPAGRGRPGRFPAAGDRIADYLQ